MSIIQAEYIWTDGTEPTPLLRSKTRMLEANVIEKVLGAITGVAALPHWGFDGSSTNQATGDDSDCQLFPVFACRDPLRGGDNLLVLCEVVTHGGRPHATNTRRAAAEIEERTKGRARLLVRHGAGVHDDEGRLPARLPRGWLSWSAGPVLLWRPAPSTCSAARSSKST